MINRFVTLFPAQKANFANQLMDIEDLVNMGKKHKLVNVYLLGKHTQ